MGRANLRVSVRISPTHRKESMQATPRHDTKRLLISVHIYTHTHDMRHTRCTDISINNGWCWFVEWRRAKMDRTKFGCTTYRRHKFSSLAQIQIYIYIIYMSYGGRAVDMSQEGGGGGVQGETTFICGRVIGGNAFGLHFDGGSATCSDGEGRWRCNGA